MREKYLEKQCVIYARRLGWDAWKNENNGNNGIPDCSFLRGDTFFMVEFKRDDKAHVAPEQLRWQQKHPGSVFFICKFSDFSALLARFS